MDIEQVAELCHEANRILCAVDGDFSQPTWENAPEWQKQSAINGVAFHFMEPNADYKASHNNWMTEKLSNGWKYGPVKDVDKKEHPCIVAFEELPKFQQTKDVLFKSIVDAVRGLVVTEDGRMLV